MIVTGGELMSNEREISKLEHEIELADLLSKQTPDATARTQYQEKINECQYIYKRLSGKYYLK